MCFFYGNEALRYPYHLFILFEVFNKANVYLGATIGTLLSASAVGMIGDHYKGLVPSMAKNILKALTRIIALLIIAALSFGILKWVITHIDPTIMKLWPNRVTIPSLAVFFTHILFQMIFIYTLPFIMLEDASLFQAIKQNFTFLISNLISTIFLFIVPACLVIPVIVITLKVDRVMQIFSPEGVLVLIGLQVFVMVVVNLIVNLGTAVLFIKKRSA